MLLTFVAVGLAVLVTRLLLDRDLDASFVFTAIVAGITGAAVVGFRGSQ
jgi:hypothetical protein